MKAIRVHRFGGPEVLQLEEVPDLQAGAGEVVVSVKAVGVNPVETYIRTGTHGIKPALPWTPGNDAAGTINQVGPGVTSVSVGERVYTAGTKSGAYAEQTLCDQAQVHKLPERVTFEQGAGVNIPMGTAWRALFMRGQAKAAETLLVHGASGGVGTAAVQLARAAGLTVIGTAGSAKGKQLVEALGAHHVLDHKSPGYLDELMKLTGGRGVDLIVEMLANVNLAKDLTVLAKFGRVVVVGNRGPTEVNMRDAMGRDADVRGMTYMNVTPAEMATIHAALGAALANGTLTPVVGKTLPLAEAGKAHELVMGAGSYGKIVLVT